MHIVLAILALILLVVFGAAAMGDYQLNSARAEAMLIKANAEADALWWQSVTPVIVAVVIGAVLIAYLIMRSKQHPIVERHIIERQVVVMLQPGQPRRELWQTLSSNLLLEGGSYDGRNSGDYTVDTPGVCTAKRIQS